MTAEARIRTLRWRLTALFTLTSLVGLVGLAVFALHSDTAASRRQLEATMDLQADHAVSLIDYDDNRRLDLQPLIDTVESDCPPLTVLSGTADHLTVARTPPRPCVPIAPDDVHTVAVAALRHGSATWADTRTPDGDPVRLLATPFSGPDDRSWGGALVTAVDTADSEAEHRQLVTLLTVGCAVLVSLSAMAGHLLSGRAIRPALTALRQQEAFLADAAHDLRTPAASLRALAETARDDDTLRGEALDRTVRLASRMSDLIDGLLTRARLMAGVATVAREPLRLDQLVEAVVDDTATHGHHVTVLTQPTVVVGDPDLLRRALANLLNNALAHGHAPGQRAEVELTVSPEGTVTIDDAGPGIPPTLAGSLFERFHSTSGSTGLGLSITSWVAHTHGGTLTVETSPRGGARFVLRLPGHTKHLP
ncbi:sensor histidine kinase [Streptomyces sp. WM6378]|uniref:sensor histidine kinase n=1 Tax=Streptomyces sp. WM6378 TaxID=1415557 RepID=UPI0006ADF2D5|nr:HAMP domain-containing sensor histidine kinase [Streptomyces sp. WM6378]KOU52287.1 histidine kinase [Streptomyces sp. WM6378]